MKLGITEMMFEAAMLRGDLAGAERDARADRMPHGMLAAPGGRIAGGTSQVQRNIIGERLLGLPRGTEAGDTEDRRQLMSFDNIDRNTNEAPPQGAKSGPRGPSPALIGAVVVLALAVVFFFQNGESSTIDFLFFEKRTTIRMSIIVAVVLGIVVDRLVGIWWHRRRRKTRR